MNLSNVIGVLVPCKQKYF